MPEHKQGNRATNQFPTDYDPDLDTTNELDEDQATYYLSQIGILHWIVELGRIDIATEVSLLASHVAFPRKEHLQTVFHIYAYLKKRHNSRLALDPSYPRIDMRTFHQADWREFYGKSRKLYLTMPQIQEENQSSEELSWTLIMQMIKSDEDHEQDSASLSIWLVLFGTQRDRQL